MARVLIVGCGCRGRELAGALLVRGHAARGTSRDPATLKLIEAAGAAAVTADPDRLATLLPQIEGVTAVCWLMGCAEGEPEAVAALHGARLRSFLERLVDTPVRAVVYEAAGSVDTRLLEEGSEIARAAGRTFRMPVEIVDADPAERPAWLEAMTAAIGRALSGGSRA